MAADSSVDHVVGLIVLFTVVACGGSARNEGCGNGSQGHPGDYTAPILCAAKRSPVVCSARCQRGVGPSSGGSSGYLYPVWRC
jgi:hypothetical protein